MSKNGDDLGVQSVVWLWGFFVSSVKYVSGAMRRPTDPPGARDAHIGIHETFLAGVLARGSGIDFAVSHCHLACQPFSHRGLLFRAGPVAACISSRLPLSPVASYGRKSTQVRILRGWATFFPSQRRPHKRCMRCAAVHNDAGTFSP